MNSERDGAALHQAIKEPILLAKCSDISILKAASVRLIQQT